MLMVKIFFKFKSIKNYYSKSQKREENRVFCLQLGALCCDCEQMLHINQQFMYKKERCNLELDDKILEERIEELGNLYGPERAAQQFHFDFEYIGHELCPDWEPTRNIDVNF
jgi:hypothetical protein